MAPLDLSSTSGLRRACSQITESSAWRTTETEWISRLTAALKRVQDADRDERASYDFQAWWWDDEAVAATGQGNVNVEETLRDEEFRRWLAERSFEELPETRSEQIAAVDRLYQDIETRVAPRSSRVPRLKILRLIALIHPEASTTICDERKLRELANAMGAPRGTSNGERNISIREGLEEAIGPPSAGLYGLAERMALPWYLYKEVARTSQEEPTETLGARSGQTELRPLPAPRRIRSLSATSAGMPLILSTLEFARDGASKEELVEHLRPDMPGYRTRSLENFVNTLQSNFGVLRREGNEYVPTERGESFRESQDPSVLADWLLTRVLGVDMAIVALRDQGPMPTAQLVSIVRACNPGWMTNFAPSATVQWLRKLGAVSLDDAGNSLLSQRGEDWAAQITWTPERLEPDVPDLPPEEAGTAAAEEGTAVERPPYDAILSSIQSEGSFADSVVASLHAGLWAHRRRHFAIFTGLSGSGKSLLARAYGRAVSANAPSPDDCLHIVTVQPGWYDPGALLGYANPLREDSYVATPFLNFLLAAVEDPGHPYTAVLDEMNLSHPEQYMAPLLSAMETPGGRIDLHSEGDVFDDIPPSIPYPANLILIGTVNMDETTHGLSDKVLDRAFTLEFWDIDLDSYPNWEREGLSNDLRERARSLLGDLMGALSPARLHFGWRIVDDVLAFLAQAEGLGAALSDTEALDGVVYARILPKLRGDDSARFREALRSCEVVLEQHDLARSRQKLAELTSDLESTGSARFWR